MSHDFRRWLTPAFGAITTFVFMAGFGIASGRINLTEYEVDVLHLMDLVLRMAEKGQVPHLDYTTPIGVLAIWPIALLGGLGFGAAFIWSQVLLAVILFLPMMRAASRFRGWVGCVYAAYVMVLCLALTYGGNDESIAIAMHYNRWAWALLYVVLPLAVLPANRPAPVLDGLLIGVGLAALALLKASYFVVFPGILVVLLARRQFSMILAALAGAGGVITAATIALGTAFWAAYIHDLLVVVVSPIRSYAGDSMTGIISGAQYALGSACAIAGIILLRRGAHKVEGLGLLFLTPAFFYIVYQNFGNDPMWLVFLGLLVLSLAAGNRRGALGVIGVVALTLSTASTLNMFLSPVRNFTMPADKMTELVPGRAGVLMLGERAYSTRRSMVWDEDGMPFAAFRRPSEEFEARKPTVLNGETLPECDIAMGLQAIFKATAQDLQAQGFGGRNILVADTITVLWLYGDFVAGKGTAPWYYGDTPGLAEADYLLVPLCPMNAKRRRIFLEAAQNAGWALDEVHRSATYILLRPERQAKIAMTAR